MVATRGTDQDVVDFVVGKERIDPATIRVEQWVPILRAAIDELPINYMRGLKSIKQILSYDGSYGVERRIDGPLPRLFPEGVDKLPGHEIRPNAVFLECASTGGGFPNGKHPFETYPKAPRAAGTFGPNTGDLLPLSTGHFLVSRSRKLSYVSVLWHPNEKWEERSMSDTPGEFWYQADLTTLTLMELDDKKLDNLLAAAHERDLPQMMLQRFNLALIETAGDARSQYDHILEKKQTIGGYLDRIGQLIH